MFRANNFDKLLDKATSNLRLDPDWPTILQICDLIRQNDCSPKTAVAAVKKKLYSQNPHQAMFALLTLESMVKNCGSGVHDEVTSKVFCEMLRDLVKTTQHENLRSKILDLIQAWAYAFRNSPKYRAVQDTVNILKAEGYKFPPLKESDAMFSADTAPEWADGEVCHRCRVAFSLMVRRHHCRACGQVFCQQCSSKTSTLPKFGIEKEVRVCDACFDKVSRPPSSTAKLEIVDTANDYGPTQPQKRTGGKTAEELQEEEELQLALALSQSEAEHKEKERKSRSYIAPDPVPQHPTLSPTPSSVSASPEHGQASAELSRYLDRGYWEQRLSRDTAAPTAPAPAPASHAPTEELPKPSTAKNQDEDAEDKEIDEFVESLKSQVEIFVNRMKSNSSRGRSIANDTAVQTLFMNITAMHSRLLRYIQEQDDKRVYLESLQDKVTQIRDSRAALDTLRAEHGARLAAAAEAAERRRQMQMAAKLQAMRKKKHEYLQYQRQLALQRVQEQEREMQMRQEQQKHQYLMSANSYYMPGVSMPQYQAGYPSQPPAMYTGAQFHPQMMPPSSTEPTPPQMSQPQPSVPMGPISQSTPQMTNAFAMSTSAAAITQAPLNMQQSMNQPNIRPNMTPLPMQQQMLMQQMQMRMPIQPGMHQMIPQNMTNGLPGQSISQQNGQVSKQNIANQPPNSIMPPISVVQPNMPPSMINLNNPMMGIQNVRIPGMHSNQPQNTNNQQVPVSGYSMNIQNQVPNMQQQPNQGSNMQQHSHLPGQPLQGQSQGLQIHNHIPPNQQNMPSQNMQIPQPQNQQIPQHSQQQQLTHNQQMPVQGQSMQNLGQQMMIQSQMPPLTQPTQQMMNQGQQMMTQGQQMMNQGQQVTQGQLPSGQNPQIPQGQLPPGQGPQVMHTQQMSHQMQLGGMQQLAHESQLPAQQGGQQIHQMQQGQPIQQGPQMQQAQPMSQIAAQPKMQQQNFNNMPPGQQPPPANQQSQQAQTVKSEHNNKTAELISFD